MNRFYFFVLFFCFTNIINITFATELSTLENTLNPVGDAINLYEKAPAAISATITGPASVCLNSTNQNVTFTGSGGTAPYSFKYKIIQIIQII